MTGRPAGAQRLAALTGRRVSIRLRLPDGQATDVVGWLSTTGDGLFWVDPGWSGPRRIDPAAVVAVRAVPDPVIRPASSIPKLGWLMDQAWPGLQRQRLGGWVLRFGGGIDSVLTLADPDRPLPDAVDEVERAYRSRSLTPVLHQAHPLPGSTRPEPAPGLAAELARRGYRVRARRLVLTAPVQDPPPDPVGPAPHWSGDPTPQWIAAHAGGGLSPSARDVLAAPGCGFGSLTRDGDIVATVRVCLRLGWAGLSLAGHPGRRDEDLDLVLLRAGLSRAARHGARFAHLQVEEEWADRYRPEGFEPHHRSELWTAPGPGADEGTGTSG